MPDTIEVNKDDVFKIYHEALHLAQLARRHGSPLIYAGAMQICKHLEEAAPALKETSPLR